jgi:hypothetical protein
VLVDPLGLAPGAAFVPDGLLPLVAKMDGSRTLAEIEAELTAEHGQPLPPGFLADLVGQLDGNLLLLTPRFRAAAGASARAFLAQSIRPARHAGSPGYPARRLARRRWRRHAAWSRRTSTCSAVAKATPRATAGSPPRPRLTCS